MENTAILYQIENSDSAGGIGDNFAGSQAARDSVTNNCQRDNELGIQ